MSTFYYWSFWIIPSSAEFNDKKTFFFSLEELNQATISLVILDSGMLLTVILKHLLGYNVQFIWFDAGRFLKQFRLRHIWNTQGWRASLSLLLILSSVWYEHFGHWCSGQCSGPGRPGTCPLPGYGYMQTHRLHLFKHIVGGRGGLVQVLCFNPCKYTYTYISVDPMWVDNWYIVPNNCTGWPKICRWKMFYPYINGVSNKFFAVTTLLPFIFIKTATLFLSEITTTTNIKWCKKVIKFTAKIFGTPFNQSICSAIYQGCLNWGIKNWTNHQRVPALIYTSFTSDLLRMRNFWTDLGSFN